MNSGGQVWTLEEGLRFASEPKLAEHWAALTARFMAGGKVGDREEVADLRERMEISFVAAMRDGALSAWGRTASGRVEIPAHTWVDATLVDWERSAIATSGAGWIEDVRLVPWLHLSDITARLDGLSLQEAFRRFVRNDLEVVDRLRWAAISFVGDYSSGCAKVADGWFTSAARLWPVSLDSYDLASEWLDVFKGSVAQLEPERKRGHFDWLATKTPEDIKAFAAIRAAEAVIRDRFNRLLAPLRSGEMEAAGQLRDGSAPAVVAQGVWVRPRTRIDFVDGELHRVSEVEVRTDDSLGYEARTEITNLEWSGLTLRLVAGASRAPSPPAMTTRDLGGAPETHAWADVYDRLVVRLALHGFPDRGVKADLSRMMLDCFEEANVPVPTEPSVSRWLRETHPLVWFEAGQRRNT